MSLDKLDKLNKLNKLQKYNASEVKSENKSTTKNTIPSATPATPSSHESILNKDSYLLGRIKGLEDEIFLLRSDLISILDALNNDISNKYTALSLRQKYSDFRASEEHVLRRIVNKTESINKNELHFNDEQNKTDI